LEIKAPKTPMKQIKEWIRKNILTGDSIDGNLIFIPYL